MDDDVRKMLDVCGNREYISAYASAMIQHSSAKDSKFLAWGMQAQSRPRDTNVFAAQLFPTRGGNGRRRSWHQLEAFGGAK